MNKPAIQIHVTTEYLPGQSDPERHRFAFAYHITIENGGDAAAQLISRHWIITDANERRQEVRGLGVIGEQPVIAPGQSYRYTSGAIIDTEVGTMGGSYQMRGANGDQFDVPIPTFVLAVPRAVH